ncbi:hypothetical protein OPT61_g3637 [Boeremia exigua]|uniref:Uncharacterized protein n=1 Tax=Boeremia exigua TaxID=749465 RepID=A0ACC2IH65_9PLEO|nr:hypothetical protein OPT61_g3637 [Boeremia exigua]
MPESNPLHPTNQAPSDQGAPKNARPAGFLCPTAHLRSAFGDTVGPSDCNRTSSCREAELELKIERACKRHNPFCFLDNIGASSQYSTTLHQSLVIILTDSMKTAAYVALVAAAIPAVWSLPASFTPKPFNVPTCGAESCLASSNGTFVANGTSNGTAPNDLGRICSLPQADVTSYVETVQPCIDGEAGKKACSEGAIVPFVKDWLDACQRVGKLGWDNVSPVWEPYLPRDGEVVLWPTTYLNMPPEPKPTRSSSVLVVTSTDAIATSLAATSLATTLLSSLPTTLSSATVTNSAITKNSDAPITSSSQLLTSTTPQPSVVDSAALSPGAIGGIAAGILILVLLCAGLGYFYWKANKRAKQKNKEIAILNDRVSGCGFQRYIDELLEDGNSETGTVVRHDVSSPEGNKKAPSPTGVAEVKEQAVSVKRSGRVAAIILGGLVLLSHCEVIMLWLLFLSGALVRLVAAQTGCVTGSPQLSLPSCMDECFSGGGCSGDKCPCAQNLKGWCTMNEDGPDSWFGRWGQCVLNDCPDDGDITNLMLLFTAQCEGTVGGPLNNDTVPYPLRDWAPKNTATGSTETPNTATLTSNEPTASAGSATTTDESKATALDDVSLSSDATSTATSAPSTQDDPKPALSKGAIIGIAVGGTFLLALIISLVAFLLRRRKRREPSPVIQLPTVQPPPGYEGVDKKDGYDKPELDGQVLAYQYSKSSAGAPTDAPTLYAELDGGGTSRS